MIFRESFSCSCHAAVLSPGSRCARMILPPASWFSCRRTVLTQQNQHSIPRNCNQCCSSSRSRRSSPTPVQATTQIWDASRRPSSCTLFAKHAGRGRRTGDTACLDVEEVCGRKKSCLHRRGGMLGVLSVGCLGVVARLPRKCAPSWCLSFSRLRRRVVKRDRDGGVNYLQASHNRRALVIHGSMPVER